MHALKLIRPIAAIALAVAILFGLEALVEDWLVAVTMLGMLYVTAAGLFAPRDPQPPV